MRARALLWWVVGLVGATLPSAHASAPPLADAQVIALPGVERRIDHFAVDPAGKRLFVAALGNGTLEVVDLGGGKRITSIAGLKEPQGVAYLPLVHRIVVAMRGGAVAAFDDGSYQRTATIPNMSDADNLRYDAAAGQLYVGYGEGALGVIDPPTMKLVGKIPPGNPPGAVSPADNGA